jgi:hypothetical protein
MRLTTTIAKRNVEARAALIRRQIHDFDPRLRIEGRDQACSNHGVIVDEQ